MQNLPRLVGGALSQEIKSHPTTVKELYPEIWSKDSYERIESTNQAEYFRLDQASGLSQKQGAEQAIVANTRAMKYAHGVGNKEELSAAADAHHGQRKGFAGREKGPIESSIVDVVKCILLARFSIY